MELYSQAQFYFGGKFWAFVFCVWALNNTQSFKQFVQKDPYKWGPYFATKTPKELVEFLAGLNHLPVWIFSVFGLNWTRWLHGDGNLMD
jgi:hypothetical protein